MAETLDPTVSIDSDSTELSSILSSVPSTPPTFPLSPESSQDLEHNGAAIKENPKRKLDGEEAPVPRKRKRPEPKPRTVERLDLTDDARDLASDQKPQMERLLKVLRKRRKIVVIAGAGISVSAGSMDHI